MYEEYNLRGCCFIQQPVGGLALMEDPSQMEWILPVWRRRLRSIRSRESGTVFKGEKT